MIRQRHRYARPDIFTKGLNRFTPSPYGVFFESAKMGLVESPMYQGIELAEYMLQKYLSEPIRQDQFESATEGLNIQYEEGMTIGQLDLLKKTHERDRAYSWFTRNVGPWEPSRIGGFVGSGVLDPLVAIPFGGMVARMGATAKAVNAGVHTNFASKMFKPIGDVASVGAEAGMYAVLAESIIWPKKRIMQQPWGVTEVLADVGFSIAAGSSLAAFAKIAPVVVKAPFKWRAGALTKVSKDIGDGELGSVMPNDYNPRDPNNPFQPAGPRYPEHGIEPSSIARQASEDANRRLSWAKREGDAARANETVELFEEGLGTAIDSVVTPEFQSKLVNFTGSVVNRTADEFEKIVNYAASCWRKGQ